MPREFDVYIMTNVPRGTLYAGVTSDLARRVEQHKTKQGDSSFTRRYNLTMLVDTERADDARAAIEREKQLTGWSRSKKIALVESSNPQWRDLSNE